MHSICYYSFTLVSVKLPVLRIHYFGVNERVQTILAEWRGVSHTYWCSPQLP